MIKKLYIAIFILFGIQICFSQNDFFIGFKDSNQTSVTIDFKFVNNLIVIPLQINSSDTLWFILDTGIRPTLLTNFVDTIEFQTAKSTTIRGLGEGEDLTVWHTYGNILTLKDITLENQNVFVLERDKFGLSEKMGMTINGIIGFPIFDNFIVEINFKKREITFSNPEKFVYKKNHKKWVQMPLNIYNGKPYTNMLIEINKDTIINANVLIDLGASDALWLFPNSNDSINVKPNKTSYYLGQGLNGNIFGQQSKINKLVLNDKYSLKNVTVSYPDTSGLQVDEDYDIPGRNGSIGSEVLRRFNIIIDYQNKKMLLQRNSDYNDEFNFDLSGLEIIAPYVSLRYYEIFYVQKNSPADEAGLKAGDQILKINNLSATEYSFNDIILILRSKEGRKVRFVVDRNGEKISTKFTLENYRDN